MNTLFQSGLLVASALLLTACGGGGDSQTQSAPPDSHTPVPDPGPDPDPGPTPAPETADLFVGSWLQGKSTLGSTNCILDQIVLTKTAKNALQGSLERTRFETHNKPDCTGGLVSERKYAIDNLNLKNIQAAETADGYTYHHVTAQRQPSLDPAAYLLVKTGSDSFCLMQGNQPSNIKTWIETQNTPLKSYNCYTRSSEAFTAIKPGKKIDQPLYLFEKNINTDNKTLFVNQLNELGRKGYVMLAHNWQGLRENFGTVFIKAQSSQDTFTYVASDLTPADSASYYFDWFNLLTAQGKQGYAFNYGVNVSTLKYIEYFIKNDQKPATYSYERTYFQPVTDANDLIAQLNALGSKGCRLIDFGRYYTGSHPDIFDGKQNQPKIATCMNSSTHHGKYNYRFFSSRTNTQLDSLINQQSKEGYRLISSKISLSNTSNDNHLFMKDSEDTILPEYKVFSDSIVSPDLNSSEPVLADIKNRLSAQSQHGWFMTQNPNVYSNSAVAIQTELNASIYP